jgi:hypothetical protein
MVERDDDRHGAGSEEHDDPDAPASAEEVAASKRLRDALENASVGAFDVPATPEAELAFALRAAWDPGVLSVDESRAVLDATPSAEEQALATLLRDALAEKREPVESDHAGVHFARALRSAFAPSAIDAAEHRAIIDAALARMPARKGEVIEKKTAGVVQLRRRATVVRVAFGVVAGGLALAASIVFVVTSAPLREHEAPLAKARTTQPLFSEPFKPGETSARIDRIASARASDFRDNRFTKWGVR